MLNREQCDACMSFFQLLTNLCVARTHLLRTKPPLEHIKLKHLSQMRGQKGGMYTHASDLLKALSPYRLILFETTSLKTELEYVVCFYFYFYYF